MNDCISRRDAIRIVDSIDTWQAGWRGNAIESLKAMPSAHPEQSIAQERYEDLCEYFKVCSDQGRSTLNDRKEFKAWLDRMKWHVMECDKLGRELEKLKSVQPDITPDGTLTVSIDADIASVGRILLSQAGTQRGGLYYKDAQPEETCDTCKYGYFGDGMCDYCRVRYPSHYERKTDER